MIASATLTNTRLNVDMTSQNIINPNLNVFPEEINSVEVILIATFDKCFIVLFERLSKSVKTYLNVCL